MFRGTKIASVAAILIVSVPASAADRWTRLSSPNLELYTTAGEKEGRNTILHFERVREFFQQASPVRSQGDLPVRIVQFDTEAQYRPFRPGDHVAAYFTETPERDYIVMGDRASEDFGPATHEYTHLVVRRSGFRVPVWLNEGWAEVFSTLRPMGKDMAVGDLLPERMKALAAEKWMDFDELTAVDTHSAAYHEASRVGIFYAESWALVHMLFLSPEYKDDFGKFVTALNGGKTSREACEVAFGKSSSRVFEDLQTYFVRKKIFGTVFETRLDKREAEVQATAVSNFDARLMLADLTAARGKADEARLEYAKLEAEAPGRADLLESIGNLAFDSHDKATAQTYFERAYAAGNADPRVYYRLAMLDVEAKMPPSVIIPILERAVAARPDFTDAKLRLGLLKAAARDFAGSVQMLESIPVVTPQMAPSLFCMLALGQIQTGDLSAARQSLESCRKWAKTPEQSQLSGRIGKFVEARLAPAAGVHRGEQLTHVTGIARSVECSGDGNRLHIFAGDKVVVFDLPGLDAVELPSNPRNAASFECGPMRPIGIGVEFAPPPSAKETSVGIVRRLDY